MENAKLSENFMEDELVASILKLQVSQPADYDWKEDYATALEEKYEKNDDVDDFEDALQIECAKEFNADYVVTRDLPGFSGSGIETISPIDFIKIFSK